MKIARFSYRQEPRYGLIKNDHIELIQGEPFSDIRTTGVSVALAKAKLLAPVAPSKVIAVGLNYRDHAKELNMKLPELPRLFLKPSSSVIGTGEEIIYPPYVEQVDYEAELVIVIGKQAKGVTSTEAKQYIFGYTCGNDVTARDLQRLDGYWTRSKSFDTFCPLGPYVETELNASDLEIRSILNEEIKQDSRTSQMIFGVEKLVEFISGVMTLFPGDVIMTGTPFGVGPMQVNDVVEIEIEGIGVLSNKVS